MGHLRSTSKASGAGTQAGLQADRDRDTRLHMEELVNPYAGLSFEPARAAAYRSVGAIQKAHGAPVTALAFHPTKPVVATASDDATWALWAMPPSGSVAGDGAPGSGALLSGGTRGGRLWLADIEFHPGRSTVCYAGATPGTPSELCRCAAGTHLVTGGGDGTVTLWELATGSVVANWKDIHAGAYSVPVRTHSPFIIDDHRVGGGATWGVSFHATGDWLLTGNMDHSAKIVDVSVASVKRV
jgi:WD40 repeat protein